MPNIKDKLPSSIYNILNENESNNRALRPDEDLRKEKSLPLSPLLDQVGNELQVVTEQHKNAIERTQGTWNKVDRLRLDKVSGPTLDELGALIGIQRESLTEPGTEELIDNEVYRPRILAQIILNTLQNSIGDINRAADELEHIEEGLEIATQTLLPSIKYMDGVCLALSTVYVKDLNKIILNQVLLNESDAAIIAHFRALGINLTNVDFDNPESIIGIGFRTIPFQDKWYFTCNYRNNINEFYAILNSWKKSLNPLATKVEPREEESVVLLEYVDKTIGSLDPTDIGRYDYEDYVDPVNVPTEEPFYSRLQRFFDIHLDNIPCIEYGTNLFMDSPYSISNYLRPPVALSSIYTSEFDPATDKTDEYYKTPPIQTFYLDSPIQSDRVLYRALRNNKDGATVTDIDTLEQGLGLPTDALSNIVDVNGSPYINDNGVGVSPNTDNVPDGLQGFYETLLGAYVGMAYPINPTTREYDTDIDVWKIILDTHASYTLLFPQIPIEELSNLSESAIARNFVEFVESLPAAGINANTLFTYGANILHELNPDTYVPLENRVGIDTTTTLTHNEDPDLIKLFTFDESLRIESQEAVLDLEADIIFDIVDINNSYSLHKDDDIDNSLTVDEGEVLLKNTISIEKSTNLQVFYKKAVSTNTETDQGGSLLLDVLEDQYDPDTFDSPNPIQRFDGSMLAMTSKQLVDANMSPMTVGVAIRIKEIT